MTRREAEFDEDDVADMLAHIAAKANVGRYGEDLEEATSDKAAPGYYGDDAIRYVAKYTVNHAEEAVELLRETEKDSLPKHGVQFYVEREAYE